MATGSGTMTPATAPPGPGAVHTPRTTVQDAVERLLDYQGADVAQVAQTEAVRAVLASLRELAACRRWSYYLTQGRVQTVAPYSTGTVTYLHSSGTYARQLTLSGGTWPTWALQGTVRVGEACYRVASRISGTVLQLDAAINPGPQGDDDVSAASYSVYQEDYVLPADFVSADQALGEASWGGSEYVHPAEWLRAARFTDSQSNTPRFYTFLGSRTYPGRLAVALFPYPDSAKTVDFLYHRLPRQVSTVKYKAGTVSATSGLSVLTGSGTAWSAAMAGSVVRVYSDAVNEPTDLAGAYPYAEEKTIISVDSATQFTVDEPFAATYSGVKYRVSDPVDVEQGAMLNAFFRCCEKQVATQKRMKEANDNYRTALELAKEADSRSFAGRQAGPPSPYRQRLRDMPLGADS